MHPSRLLVKGGVEPTHLTVLPRLKQQMHAGGCLGSQQARRGCQDMDMEKLYMACCEQTCDQEHCWRDERSHSPAELLEDPPRQDHHGERDCSCCSGEVSHEG